MLLNSAHQRVQNLSHTSKHFHLSDRVEVFNVLFLRTLSFWIWTIISVIILIYIQENFRQITLFWICK